VSQLVHSIDSVNEVSLERCHEQSSKLIEERYFGRENSRGEVNLHFTVSDEHISYFNSLWESKKDNLSYRYGANFNVSFSVQDHATDTVAVDMDNNPLRGEDGKLVFRPGGHGALLKNLNDIDADIIFIKNIDNVSPDIYKQPTIENKFVLAGMLVKLQKTIFEYHSALESGSSLSDDNIQKMLDFCQNKLCVTNKFNPLETKADKIAYLKMVLNRPLRVCGMVKKPRRTGWRTVHVPKPERNHLRPDIGEFPIR